MLDHTHLLNCLTVTAREAGAAIMEIYQQNIEVETKEDGSPVTIADKAA